MDASILEQLKADFPRVLEKPGGGKTFKYVPSEDIFSRMNDVFLGNWSTKVLSQEIVDDQVLVRVAVSAQDPNDPDGRIFQHEGYAGQPIARYNHGDKAGQIIDIGNSYMAAMTKAIKQAVKKWGVALYIEGPSEGSGSTGGFNPPPNSPTPSAPTPPPAPAPPAPLAPSPAGSPGPAPSMPVPPAPSGQSSNGWTPPPVNNSPAPPSPEPSAPPAPSVPPAPPAPPVQSTSPPAEPQSSLPSTPAPMADTPVASPSTEAPTPRGTITDVQRIALNGILGLKEISYNDLVAKAFEQKGIQKDRVPEMDELNFDEAAVIIKYGNDLYRKK